MCSVSLHLFVSSSTSLLASVTSAVAIVVVLSFVDALITHRPRWEWDGWWEWWWWSSKQFWLTLQFFALPLNLTDTFAALAADIFGQLDEFQNILLH